MILFGNPGVNNLFLLSPPNNVIAANSKINSYLLKTKKNIFIFIRTCYVKNNLNITKSAV